MTTTSRSSRRRPDDPLAAISETAAEIREYREIPDHILWSLYRYLEHRSRPGDFVAAVLSNDLKGAVSYADSATAEKLPEIVRLVQNHFPSDVWGDRETFENYTAGG
ncbi:MAG: hypothetical protein ABEN55_11965 [Bradymonadaceae bacterium]